MTDRDFSLDDIFVNLKLISHIEAGNKLKNINDKYLNIDSNIFNFFTRWLNGANRNDTVIFLRKLYSRTTDYNNELFKKDDNIQLFRLTTSLKSSIDGLINLKQTYKSDKLITSEIDVIIENIRVIIDMNMKKIKI